MYDFYLIIYLFQLKLVAVEIFSQMVNPIHYYAIFLICKYLSLVLIP